MSMCESAILLISKALPTVNDDEKLLKIKGRIALFIQTMDVSCSYYQCCFLLPLTTKFSVGAIASRL